MKNKFWLVLAISIAMAVFGSCRDNNSNISAEGINLNKDASYALGMSIGSDFKENIIASGIIPDMDEFLKGIRDVMTDKKTRFNVMEAEEIINHAFSSIMQDRNAAAAQEEITFLAENSRKPGVRITSSGLQYEIITEGSGQKPSFNSTVVVHYEGSLIDGTVFDSSYSRGSPAELPLDRVIPGWSEGLQLMSIGSQYIFYIPSEIGYGPGGWGPIPPFATLIFVVDLIDIIN
jgi:FKBP-type peptidyl-prolyl cis-trans isomerase